MIDPRTSILADGIRYLRGGSLERAHACFEQASRSRDPRIRSEAFRRLADVQRRRAEWAEALDLTARARRVAAEHHLKDEEAAALNVEGTIHLQRGDFEGAIALYGQALARDPGAHQRGLICQNLGTAFAQHGMLAEATEWYASSSDSFRSAGRRREALLVQINQGNIQLDRGDLGAAETLFREAISYVGELASPDAELQGLVEMNLAETLARRGTDLEWALDLVLSATGHFAASGNRPHLVACHRVLALISEQRGELDTARSALERGRALAAEIGSGPEIAHFEREISRLTGETYDSCAD